MSLDINLSSGQVEKKPMSKVVLIGTIFFILSIVVTGALIIYNFLLSSQITALEVEQDQLERAIEVELSTENRYITYINKLSALGKVLEMRDPLDVRLDLVLSNLPSGVEMSGLEISPLASLISLQSDDLASIKSFLEGGIDAVIAGDSEIEKIDVQSFGRDNERNVYEARILVTYKEGAQQ